MQVCRCNSIGPDVTEFLVKIAYVVTLNSREQLRIPSLISHLEDIFLILYRPDAHTQHMTEIISQRLLGIGELQGSEVDYQDWATLRRYCTVHELLARSFVRCPANVWGSCFTTTVPQELCLSGTYLLLTGICARGSTWGREE